MQRTLSITLAVCLMAPSAAQTPKQREASARDIRRAFHRAVDLNISYCREWLEGNDYKSLRKTAIGIRLLAIEAQSIPSSDAWQAACKKLKDTNERLLRGAANSSQQACEKSLAALESQQQATKNQLDEGDAKGKRVDQPVTRPRLGELMTLIDGTYADAKTAISVGDVEEAKQYALVIAQFGDVLSEFNEDAKWTQLSIEMADIAERTALSSITNGKKLRAQLKLMYAKCAACHDR